MSNPVQLIPAKVRLVIYLAVFLFSLALTAIGQYYQTLEQPIPDVVRGLGGAVAPIAAVFSAVAASNTFQNPEPPSGSTINHYGSISTEGGRVTILAALAGALLVAAVVSLILGAHPVLVFLLFAAALLAGWFVWYQHVHATATFLDDGKTHHVATAFEGGKKTIYVDGRRQTILDRDWH